MSTKFKQKQFRKKRKDSSDEEDNVGDHRPFTPSGYRTRPIRYSLGWSGKQSAAVYPATCVKPIVLLVMDSNGRNAVLPQKVRPSRNACFELAAISIPGGKTFHACSELQHLESCKLDVSHVVLALGTNDMSEGRRVLHSFNSRIEKLIQVTRYVYPNSKIAYNSILRRHDENGMIVREANEIIRCVTKKHQIPYLDMNIPKDPAYWSDLIHLSDVGLQIYMNIFEREVTEKLFKDFENKITKPLIKHSTSFSSLQDHISSSRNFPSSGSQSFSCRDVRSLEDDRKEISIRKIFKRRAEFLDEEVKYGSKRKEASYEDSHRESLPGKRRSEPGKGVENIRRREVNITDKSYKEEDSRYKNARRNRFERAGWKETRSKQQDVDNSNEDSSEKDSFNERRSRSHHSQLKDSRRKSESSRSNETMRGQLARDHDKEVDEDSLSQSRRSEPVPNKETKARKRDENKDLSDEGESYNNKKSHPKKLKRRPGSGDRELDVADHGESHKKKESHCKKSRRRKSEPVPCTEKDSICSKQMRFSDGSSFSNVGIREHPNQENLDKSFSKRHKNKCKMDNSFFGTNSPPEISEHPEHDSLSFGHPNQDKSNSLGSFSGSKHRRFTDERRVTKDSIDEDRSGDSTAGGSYDIHDEEKTNRNIKISSRRKVVVEDVHWSKKKIDSILKGFSNK